MSFTVPLPPRTQLYNRSCSNKDTQPPRTAFSNKHRRRRRRIYELVTSYSSGLSEGCSSPFRQREAFTPTCLLCCANKHQAFLHRRESFHASRSCSDLGSWIELKIFGDEGSPSTRVRGRFPTFEQDNDCFITKAEFMSVVDHKFSSDTMDISTECTSAYKSNLVQDYVVLRFCVLVLVETCMRSFRLILVTFLLMFPFSIAACIGYLCRYGSKRDFMCMF